ncbi:hypothetical protein [Siccirubricoccus deserti]|uniref:Uncharacterized protein n=1 Tax=Siccirubricoccus deserti TaxID=2013562 RepID=A0A9X0R1V0_9PROT|nr:hypothetical protein [Siccirubricoccus deserti]MBC4018171.1 hypothetical protein [Siccirubricoccus deserti]
MIEAAWGASAGSLPGFPPSESHAALRRNWQDDLQGFGRIRCQACKLWYFPIARNPQQTTPFSPFHS